MMPYRNQQAWYEKALCLAQDQALFGNDEHLEAVQRMRPESLSADDLRLITRIVTVQNTQR